MSTTTTNNTTNTKTRAEWRVPAMPANALAVGLHGHSNKTLRDQFPERWPFAAAAVDGLLWNGQRQSLDDEKMPDRGDPLVLAHRAAKGAIKKAMTAAVAAAMAARKIGDVRDQAAYTAAMNAAETAFMEHRPKAGKKGAKKPEPNELADAVGLIMAHIEAGTLPAEMVKKLKSAIK